MGLRSQNHRRSCHSTKQTHSCGMNHFRRLLLDGRKELERVEKPSLPDTLDPWLVMFIVLFCTEVFSDTLVILKTQMESFVCCMKEHQCLSSWNRLVVFLLLELNVLWRSPQKLCTSVFQLLWDPRTMYKKLLMHMLHQTK